MIDTHAVREYLLELQGRIVEALQAADGKPFLRDAWQRPPGGKLEGDGLTQLRRAVAAVRREG